MWPVPGTSSDAGAPVANVLQSIDFRIVFNTPAKACWSLIVNPRRHVSRAQRRFGHAWSALRGDCLDCLCKVVGSLHGGECLGRKALRGFAILVVVARGV
eukprot:scaffold36000_cov60-Phaeocystis_antarctica.AAC.2